MARISLDECFITIAETVAKRSTCVRRSVGCVVTDRFNRILSTGHNGVPPNVPHCTDNPCAGAKLPSGTGLDLCQATHAEMNALLFCPDINKVERIYVTAMPCLGCVKIILTTSCKEVVYKEPYNSEHDAKVVELLTNMNVKVRQYEHRT